jgi:hypothetical protein
MYMLATACRGLLLNQLHDGCLSPSKTSHLFIFIDRR